MRERLKAWLALLGSELHVALGIGQRNSWPALIMAVASSSICVVTFYATGWLGSGPHVDPEKKIIVVLLLQFLFWLAIFHMVAWYLKRWIPRGMVGVIDYFYLGTAALGLTASVLRQEVEHSQYAAQWFPTALPWLVAALALRLTKTTIEVFGWYRRQAT